MKETIRLFALIQKTPEANAKEAIIINRISTKKGGAILISKILSLRPIFPVSFNYLA